MADEDTSLSEIQKAIHRLLSQNRSNLDEPDEDPLPLEQVVVKRNSGQARRDGIYSEQAKVPITADDSKVPITADDSKVPITADDSAGDKAAESAPPQSTPEQSSPEQSTPKKSSPEQSTPEKSAPEKSTQQSTNIPTPQELSTNLPPTVPSDLPEAVSSSEATATGQEATTASPAATATENDNSTVNYPAEMTPTLQPLTSESDFAAVATPFVSSEPTATGAPEPQKIKDGEMLYGNNEKLIKEDSNATRFSVNQDYSRNVEAPFADAAQRWLAAADPNLAPQSVSAEIPTDSTTLDQDIATDPSSATAVPAEGPPAAFATADAPPEQTDAQSAQARQGGVDSDITAGQATVDVQREMLEPAATQVESLTAATDEIERSENDLGAKLTANEKLAPEAIAAANQTLERIESFRAAKREQLADAQSRRHYAHPANQTTDQPVNQPSDQPTETSTIQQSAPAGRDEVANPAIATHRKAAQPTAATDTVTTAAMPSPETIEAEASVAAADVAETAVADIAAPAAEAAVEQAVETTADNEPIPTSQMADTSTPQQAQVDVADQTKSESQPQAEPSTASPGSSQSAQEKPTLDNFDSYLRGIIRTEVNNWLNHNLPKLIAKQEKNSG